jgi:hypothetical protein
MRQKALNRPVMSPSLGDAALLLHRDHPALIGDGVSVMPNR